MARLMQSESARCWGMLSCLVLAMAARADDAMKIVGWAPRESTIVFAIDEPSRHRQALAERPISDAAVGLARRREAIRSWLALLGRGPSESAAVFDGVASKVLLVCIDESQSDDVSWAIFGHGTTTGVDRLLKTAGALPRAHKQDHSMLTLDEGRVLFLRREGRWLIGPSASPRLLHRMKPLLVGQPPERTMAETRVHAQAAFLGACDAAALALEGDDRETSYAAAALHRTGSHLTCEFVVQTPDLESALGRTEPTGAGILEVISHGAALAVVEPMPRLTSEQRGLLRTVMPEIELTGEERAVLGPRIMVLIRPVDGDERPAVFWGVEVRNVAVAESMLDDVVDRSLASLGLSGPATALRTPGRLRVVDAGPVVRALVPVPGVVSPDETVELGWQLVTRRRGSADETTAGWWIIGTPAERVTEVGVALARHSGSTSEQAAWLSRGMIDGNKAAMIVPDVAWFGLSDWRRLFEGIEGSSWAVRRTSPRSLEGRIQVDLDRPEDRQGRERSVDP
jgi:hypothetical protein